MSKPPLIIEATAKHQHSVIWLHGLGADASDFHSLIPYLSHAQHGHIRWIFPYAPIQAVTLNGGMKMPSWYDIRDMDLELASNIDDAKRSAEIIQQLCVAEKKVKVHLAGFSQGGLVALQAGTMAEISSLLALSTYHPLAADLVYATDVAIHMMHGNQDPVVPFAAGQRTFETIAKNHKNIQCERIFNGARSQSS